MIKDVSSLLLVFALIGATNVAIGQTTTSPDSALHEILNSLEGLPLSLQTAIQNALENATSVRMAQGTLMAARGKMRRERGLFDPELFFNLNYLDQKNPTASFFAGAQVLSTTETSSRTGLRMSLPIGTKLEASLNTVRSQTNSAFAFLNPQYTAFGSLSLRQPLLGGFQSSARKELSRSEEEYDAAQARYDQEVLAVASEVERSYWDLYASERNYAVRKLILQQAGLFLAETELRARTGLIGPNQVASAKTFFAEQTLLLLEGEEQLDRLADHLASLIGVRPSGKTRFIPSDAPPDKFPDVKMDGLVERAKEHNLELHAAQSDVEAIRAQANAAGWQVLPSVDFIGSIGGNGLGGAGQSVVFGSTSYPAPSSKSFWEAVGQVTSRDFPNWSVGVEVKIPIGFRNGLGEKERLDGEVMIAEQRYVGKVRTLEEQVRSTYRELFHGSRRLEAAKDGVLAAQEQVRIGLIEFRNGRSTAFELVRLGADFAAAQQRYSEALVRTAKAATTLRELTSGEYPATTSH